MIIQNIEKLLTWFTKLNDEINKNITKDNITYIEQAANGAWQCAKVLKRQLRGDENEEEETEVKPE